MSDEEITSKMSAVYDKYVDALEIDSVETVQKYARATRPSSRGPAGSRRSARRRIERNDPGEWQFPLRYFLRATTAMLAASAAAVAAARSARWFPSGTAAGSAGAPASRSAS
jgi:hypothetical protein